MEIFRHIDDHKHQLTDSVVTMGNFDGLHLGHRGLVQSAVEDARRFRSVSVVLTFEPHPLRVLAPERAPKLILSHKDKMQLLQSFGIDIVIIQNFDAAFADLQPETFVCDVLVGRLHTKKIWVGKDFRFGKGRKGTVADLAHWGAAKGFELGIVEPILVDGARVSSSKIRQLIEEGCVEDAQRMLGRYHFISGKVVAGQRRGRDLGFPTANIASRTEVIPQDGIYATLLAVRGERRLSVSNIGFNPTFGPGPRTIESFVLDFDDEIYGESVKLSFVKRLRGEKKFASADELVAQMHQDVQNARAVFDRLGLAHQPDTSG